MRSPVQIRHGPPKKMLTNNHNPRHYLFTIIDTFVLCLIKSITWALVGTTGLLILQTKKTPWDILIGLPLFLIGGGFVVNYMSSLFLSVFISYYNRGICKLCGDKPFKNHVKVKKILGINH